MRIALLGADGQLGRELRGRLGGQVVALGHAEVELTDADSVAAALAGANPQFVINAAAYNQVDRAEQEPDVAFAVNALGPRNLAMACRSRDVPLLHVSSDYVFSGRVLLDESREPSEGQGSRVEGREPEGECESARRRAASIVTRREMPYRELDRPDPLSAYGVSKLAGELFVRHLCRRHFVVRTCGLYGPTRTPGSGNFVQTMLRLGRERGEVSVVDDQTCCPTSTADLARAIEALIAGDAWGLYHATSSGSATWCEFAREIFRLAKMNVAVRPISSREHAAAAIRPAYSALDCGKLSAAVGFALPPWQEALAQYVDTAG